MSLALSVPSRAIALLQLAVAIIDDIPFLIVAESVVATIELLKRAIYCNQQRFASAGMILEELEDEIYWDTVDYAAREA